MDTKRDEQEANPLTCLALPLIGLRTPVAVASRTRLGPLGAVLPPEFPGMVRGLDAPVPAR
jgi:hypothetical protein